MSKINELNENNIHWESLGRDTFPLVTQCPFCQKNVGGDPYLTFNIDESGYGSCGNKLCKENANWDEIKKAFKITDVVEGRSNFVEQKKYKKPINSKNIKGKAIIKSFRDIKSVPISWLWEGRIALGKLTMIAGDPGLGKSFLTAALATNVSKGFPWPIDNSRPEIGDVIFLSAEDDAADTIKPRLEAMDADCSRIYVIESIQETNPETETSTQRMFSFKHDISKLGDLLVELPNCALVIIDPISAYLDSTDSNNNSDIRGLLAPLAELASKHNVAIILVSHLNKNSSANPSYRVMGSLAFTAAVRTAYIVTKDKENAERRLFMPLKNNIAKDTPGLAYSIVEINGAPVISWDSNPVEATLEEALALKDSDEHKTMTDYAVDFLFDFLSGGPMKVDEVSKEAKLAGINTKPLRLACMKLNIKPKKIGFKPAYWVWGLPAEYALKSEDVLLKTEGNFDKVRQLRNEETNDLDDFVNYLNPEKKTGTTTVDKILPQVSQKPPDQGRLPM